MAQQLAIFLGWSHLLAEFRCGFCPHAKGCTGKKAHDAVAGGIDKQRCTQVVLRGILAAKGGHGSDAVTLLFFHGKDRRVEQQVNVRFFQHFFQQNRVEDQRIAFWVAEGIFD